MARKSKIHSLNDQLMLQSIFEDPLSPEIRCDVVFHPIKIRCNNEAELRVGVYYHCKCPVQNVAKICRQCYDRGLPIRCPQCNAHFVGSFTEPIDLDH